MSTGSDLIWVGRNLSVYQPRNYLPPKFDYLPTVWLGEKTSNWDELWHDYAKRLEGYLTPDIEVADLAHTLTEGIQSEEEKVRRIQNYLQNEFTYRAILFGICA